MWDVHADEEYNFESNERFSAMETEH